MLRPQKARQRVRSPFVAAFLSLLFPGLGHVYAGASQRGLMFAAAPVLLLALALGVTLSMTRAELIALVLQPWLLTSVFIANLVALAYRLVAIVDAYRVTAYLNAWTARGGRAVGPRVRFHPVSVAGLLAVLLVMSAAHVAVARYDLILSNLSDCVFDPDRPCEGATPTPGATPDPSDEAPSTEPSLSLPPVGSALPNETPPPWNGRDRLNILLIGADEQAGAHNTDTLITLSIDPVTKQVAMFSLPRDTVNVPVPAGPAQSILGPVYTRKINSLYLTLSERPDIFPGGERTRGYNGLKAMLGELYGLDIKYFVEVNFEGFIKVVDALGGVTINVQSPVVDDRFPSGDRGRLLRIYIPTGVQHMTGEEALVYARSRNASSDFDRGQRQQRVLLSVARGTDPAAVLPRIDSLASALSEAVRTDIPRDLLDDLLGLAEEVDLRTIRSYVFAPPVYGRPIEEPVYIIIPDVEQIRTAVRDAFVVDPAFAARREKLAEEGASIWVLNGSGQEGQATTTAAYLEYLGFSASAPNQRPEERPPATRIVVYNGAQSRLPTTIATLQETFAVTAELVEDPAIRVDVVVTTAGSTPALSPPPAP